MKVFKKHALAAGVASALFAICTIGHAAHFELANASVEDINAAFDAGALSSEQLVSMYLKRIDAYDKQGPEINCVITLNREALQTARSLDRERRESGPRSPLHGIPVVVKDNIDTVDMATTGGSFVLAGAMPPDDGTVIRRLREAGAIILAKVNLDDFATMGSGFSSINGQTRNPHNPLYSPLGSSGGSGACVSAWFAPLALGTDTGGSLRSPSSVGGIVGLKPSRGMISRAGTIPTCYSFDATGPMARSVYDVAASLGPMVGYDPEDVDTADSIGLTHEDYTVFLDKDALHGARIGVVRAGAGVDPDVDAVLDRAIEDLRALGAEVIDPVSYPMQVLDRRTRRAIMGTVCETENAIYFADYFTSLGPEYPKTMAELAERGRALQVPHGDFRPYPLVYDWLKKRSVGGPAPDTAAYQSVRVHGVEMVRAGVMGVFERLHLDALIYPTRPRSPHAIDPDEPIKGRNSAAMTMPAPDDEKPKGFGLTDIANITGFPDVVVPAGTSEEGMPISISFFGPQFSEPRLLGFAYAYEQATRRQTLPRYTPALPGESFDY